MQNVHAVHRVIHSFCGQTKRLLKSRNGYSFYLRELNATIIVEAVFFGYITFNCWCFVKHQILLEIAYK